MYILMNADDMVLISESSGDLQQLLVLLQEYYTVKTNIVVFHKNEKNTLPKSWFLTI